MNYVEKDRQAENELSHLRFFQGLYVSVLWQEHCKCISKESSCGERKTVKAAVEADHIDGHSFLHYPWHCNCYDAHGKAIYQTTDEDCPEILIDRDRCANDSDYSRRHQGRPPSIFDESPAERR